MITAAGIPVVSLTLVMPRVGLWHADVELATEDDPGPVFAIEDGANAFQATVYRKGPAGARFAARVVGGAGKLGELIPVAHYRQAKVRLLVSAILADAGEQLSRESDGALLDQELVAWSRPPRGSAGAALSTLAETLGAGWRVLPDGSVWFGIDEYREPDEPIEAPELAQDPIDGAYLIATETMDLRPGITFVGRRVSRVVHTVSGGALRTKYWVEQ